MNEKEFTADGFEIVYISEPTFRILEAEFDAVSRTSGYPSPFPVVSLRDVPANIEFRLKSDLTSEKDNMTDVILRGLSTEATIITRLRGSDVMNIPSMPWQGYNL